VKFVLYLQSFKLIDGVHSQLQGCRQTDAAAVTAATNFERAGDNELSPDHPQRLFNYAFAVE
jgi:hypothetical protein